MTVGEAVQQTCPRCGSSAAGAPWCPSCGLNLRVHDGEAPRPWRGDTPRQRRPRGRLLAFAGGLLVLGGAIAAIALLAFRSSPAPSAAAAKTVVETVVQTSAGTPSLPPVTRAEMQHDLLAYAQAFSAENAVALEGLFAPGLRRQSGNGPVENLNGAIADYEHQFAGLTSPRYVLSDVGYTTGRGEGFAVGRYAITSAEGVSRGRIGFRFVVQGGFVLIDRIRAIPS